MKFFESINRTIYAITYNLNENKLINIHTHQHTNHINKQRERHNGKYSRQIIEIVIKSMQHLLDFSTLKSCT